MNKAQLCQHMVRHFRARDGRLRREDAGEFLDELQRVCVRELAAVGRFSLSKMVKFVVEPRRPRRGRDPVTGQPLAIPARRVVRARVSSLVRDAVEGPLQSAARGPHHSGRPSAP
ncbi:MAG: HU family DNA-binding protein [Acidobacteria bacterium]|nr:HU family DNA-binding protein [Acidobacteriota bacterium]